MDPKRRESDSWISRAVSLWPLILAFISVVAMATTVKNKVDDHEARITKLENALISVGNDTNRLVDELLDKK